MPNINLIDNQAICTQVTSVNNVTLANIAQIDNITKSCVTCSAIDLVFNAESCESACGGEDCVRYYTDGTVGALVNGDHIYEDAECTACGSAGYFSDRRCEGEQASCYQTDSDCLIRRVTRCS